MGSCDPKTAQKHTGYLVGGTSPFGLKKPLPVYMEASIKDLSRVYINVGDRGLLVEISADDLIGILQPTFVNVAI
ncbi:MAG: hypothetical protein LJE96_22630 [Deltaproteobacteria bacterium]|nr:hypothetical protein [Deltaproteobacteria bacterium]